MVSAVGRAREDATEDDRDHDDVEGETEDTTEQNDVGALPGTDHEPFEQSGNGEAEDEDEEVTSEGDGVDRQTE